MVKKNIFLLLAMVGLLSTWYFNIQFYINAEDTSIQNFIAQVNQTWPGKSISADLTCVVIVFFVWYIPDAIKLKMRLWWVFIPLTFLVAIAFSFPLYLYFRTKRLEQIGAVS